LAQKQVKKHVILIKTGKKTGKKTGNFHFLDQEKQVISTNNPEEYGYKCTKRTL